MQVAIVLYPGFTALDAIGPYEVLRFLPDAEIRFVGHEPGPIAADSGVLLLGVTHSFGETPEPDIVLVPGGARTASAMADEELTGWLRTVHETTRWTTSVCTGSLVLAAAGLLKGLPATTHWMAQSGLTSYGAQARRNERIVHSGKIATAAGVSAGIDLALWLVGEIGGVTRAQAAQLIIEYDPRPPFDSGHPSKASVKVRTLARAALMQHSGGISEAGAITKIAWRRAIDAARARSTRKGKRAGR